MAKEDKIEVEAHLPVTIPNFGDTYELKLNSQEEQQMSSDLSVILTNHIERKIPLTLKSEVLKRLEKVKLEINYENNNAWYSRNRLSTYFL